MCVISLIFCGVCCYWLFFPQVIVHETAGPDNVLHYNMKRDKPWPIKSLLTVCDFLIFLKDFCLSTSTISVPIMLLWRYVSVVVSVFDFRVESPELRLWYWHCVVSLGKNFTPNYLSDQVYKWVMLMVTLFQTNIPSGRGEYQYSQVLHANKTGISYDSVGLLWLLWVSCGSRDNTC